MSGLSAGRVNHNFFVRIAGRVTDESGNPIAGANLEIFADETNITGLTSAKDGRFEFSTDTDYTRRSLKAVATKEGFRTLKREIRPGEDADLVLTPEVRVPNVLNRPYADAVAELSKQNLRAVESKSKGGRPWNTVISQSPPPGQLVNPGTTVMLTVHGQAERFPWWIVMIVLAVLLVGGGVITWTVAERIRAERAQKEAEVEQKRKDDLAKAEAEQKRQDNLAKAEAEQKRKDDQAKAEAEQKRKDDLAKAEAEQKRKDDLAKAEAEQKRKDDQAKAEAEQKRKDDQAKAEAEQKRKDDLAKAEAEQKRQDDQAKAEAEQKRKDDQAKAEADRRAAATGADFVGGWRNINSSTRGMTLVVITNENERFAIHAWARCHPTDCDWGIVPASVGPHGTSQLFAVWNQGFVQRFMTVTLFRGAQPRLKIRTASHYTDNSGRPDNQMEEDFERGG
jgi:hypothetical protein